MGMSIDELGPRNETDLFYDQSFRRLLESYMPWLREHPNTQLIPIDPHHVYKYEGDFYGLLDAMGIKKSYHWTILRLNDIYRAGEVDQEFRWLMVPDHELIDKLKQMYRRKKNRSIG